MTPARRVALLLAVVLLGLITLLTGVWLVGGLGWLLIVGGGLAVSLGLAAQT